MDRIDLQLYVEARSGSNKKKIRLLDIKNELAKALQFKNERDKYIISHKASKLVEKAISTFKFSLRGQNKLFGIAKTIADLEHSRVVSDAHVSEALGYRVRC